MSSDYDLTGFKGLLAAGGLRHSEVLRRAGLPEDLLNRTHARVGADQFFAFCQAIEDAVDDPLFPIRVAEGITAELFSPPVFASLCSPDLEVAVTRLARFKPLIAPVKLMAVSHRGGLKVTWEWPKTTIAPAAFVVGSEALFLVKLARMGTRHQVRPTSVRLPKIPRERDAYEAFLGCEIHKSQELCVSFSKEDARRPFLTNNSGMWDIFEPQLRKRLSDLEGTSSFAERTRAVLQEVLPSGQVSVDVVSKRLAVSTRTLQRRLGDEETSFKDLVRQTRERLSRHYLRTTKLSSTEIAYLLGFEEPNSFFRAFQSWTGKSPEALRQTLRAQG